MYLLFDIGGTNMRLALSDGVRVIQKRMVPTPESYEEGMMRFEHMAKELLGDEVPDVVAGGFAAPIDQTNGTLGTAVNLPEWSHHDLPSDLQRLYRTPIILENDAALAGLGEAVHGAGRDYDLVAYITVGTGIGGARIVRKRIDTAMYGFEPGHMQVRFDLPISEISQQTSWGAMMREFKHHDESTQKLEQWIAYGLHNVIVMWSPEVVIVGGGLVNHGTVHIQNIQKIVHSMVYIFDKPPLILSNNLGDDSGLYGAMECANRYHN